MKNIFFTCFILIVTLVACNQKIDLTHDHAHEDDETTGNNDEVWITRKQYESADFRMGTIETKKFKDFISVAGEVHVPERNQAVISSLLGGKVSSFNWIEGQWVSEGQELLQITNPNLVLLQESYFLLKEENEYLSEEYNRIQSLSENEITARKNFLKISNELNINRVKLSSVQQQLLLYGLDPDRLQMDQLTPSLILKAPISGYITEINTLQGSYMEPGVKAMAIANNHHMHLELEILEKDILNISKGQPVVFFIQENYQDTLHAEVHLVDAVLNEDRLLKIHCHIEKDSRKNLKPGMYTTAQILIAEHEELALPESAIVERDDHFYVLVKAREQTDSLLFNELIVIPGPVQNGFTAIKNAVDLEGREVLTSGAFFLIGESGGGHSH